MLTLTALTALVTQCAPTVAPETMLRIVQHESGGNPFAIGISRGGRLSRQPMNLNEAVSTAKQLWELGWVFEMGLGQVSHRHLAKFGLTIEQIFDPCTNLRVSEAILRDCYDRAAAQWGPGQTALRAALSCYNTGSFSRGQARYVPNVINIQLPFLHNQHFGSLK